MGDFRASLDQNDVKASERTAEFGHFVNRSHTEIWGDHFGAKLVTYCLRTPVWSFLWYSSPHHSVESLVKSYCCKTSLEIFSFVKFPLSITQPSGMRRSDTRD